MALRGHARAIDTIRGHLMLDRETRNGDTKEEENRCDIPTTGRAIVMMTVTDPRTDLETMTLTDNRREKSE